MKKVESHSNVKVHYKGTLTDGQVFDNSEGREPLSFTVGQGQLIPGFEQAVLGMQVDESKTFNVPADEAYGEHSTELVQEVPKSALSDGVEPKVGMSLVTQNQQGQQLEVKVIDVKDESFIVDANHPLAGKDLVFDITVVDID